MEKNNEKHMNHKLGWAINSTLIYLKVYHSALRNASAIDAYSASVR